MTGVALALRQGTQEWLDARRELITATDVPVLLGLSPWKCEADLADEKLYGTKVDETLRMRIGSALQDLIAAEYERQTGRRTRRFRAMLRHREIEWAAASPDFGVVGERRLVEAKRSTSRARFADGIPQDVEAQVAWQLGVSGYPVADVAVLLGDDDLRVYEVAADEGLFRDLVAVAEDFRRRLADGGPFSRDLERIKRDHPRDDGSEIDADADLAAAVQALIALRGQRKALEENEADVEKAIKAAMGDHAVLRGDGWKVVWRKTKDREETDWKSLATSLLTQVPETDRAAVVGLHSSVREGFRPFRVVVDKED